MKTDLVWHKVAELDELPDGRVKSAKAGNRAIALSHFDGQYAAMDNKCPHQGGPLGEGSIEKGCLLYTSPSPRDQRGSRMPSSA